MDKATLKTCALLAEVVGGFAVVISLVFVGFQIRQGTIESQLNTSAIKASAYQDLSIHQNAVNSAAMQDLEFGQLLVDVHTDNIPPGESTSLDPRVSAYLRYTVRYADMSWKQFSEGLISEEELRSMLNPLRGTLRTRVGKSHWESRPERTTEFGAYMNNYMSEDQPDDPFWTTQSSH